MNRGAFMKKTLYLKNIGKLSEAEINLEGITVICGENNTGKSTVGKALYNIYNVFADCENSIKKQRKESISKEFSTLHADLKLIMKPENNFKGIISETQIQKKYTDLLRQCSKDEIKQILEDYETECFKIYNVSNPVLNQDERKISNWRNRALKSISDIFDISDKEIIEDTVTVKTEKVFHGQGTTISSAESVIKIDEDLKGCLMAYFKSGDKCRDIQREYSVMPTDVPVYIDSPQIIDFLSGPVVNAEMFFKLFLSPSLNRTELCTQLISGNIASPLLELASSLDNNSATRMEIIKTEKKISNMIVELNSLLNGKFESNNNSIHFKANDIAEPLDVRNLSTGIKSMAVIERCLSLGLIKEGSTLILDEPEIHLHPKWQLKYAEYIVILQKALDLTVLITTHSPQFLRAIEVYTDKYEIMDRLNVYSIENEKIRNASYSEYGITEIYEKLSAPYDELQQMLDEKYGEDDE